MSGQTKRGVSAVTAFRNTSGSDFGTHPARLNWDNA